MELILLCSHIATLLAASPTRPILIALDGRCGSGKTTLAAQLAERFPGSRTIHTDDYYLPPAQRVPGWETLPCANMDLKRLRAEVLNPARAGQPFSYLAYSCREGAYLPPVSCQPARLVIVEGSYRHHPALAGSSSPAPRRSRPAACRPGRGCGIPLLPSAGSRWKRDILQSIPLKKVQT